MGPWLIYASLVNRATMALYGGAPTGRDFGQFVAGRRSDDAGRDSEPGEDLAGERLHARARLEPRSTRFSSTGECSNARRHAVPDEPGRIQAGDRVLRRHRAGRRLHRQHDGAAQRAGRVFHAVVGRRAWLLAAECPRAERASRRAKSFWCRRPSACRRELLHHDHHAVYFDGTPRGPSGRSVAAPRRRDGAAARRILSGARAASTTR